MATALIGGLIIGFFIKGWVGVFIMPVVVTIYQCVTLFFLMKRKGIIQKRTFVIQFGWTYLTTTGFAVVAHFIKIFVL